jgi:hypothetical protein
VNYRDELKDPRWQRKRLEIMQRDNWRCQRCNREDTTLNVHHRYYLKGRAAWEYESEVLITVCEPCHESVEEFVKTLNREIADSAALHHIPAALVSLFVRKSVERLAAHRVYTSTDSLAKLAEEVFRAVEFWRDADWVAKDFLKGAGVVVLENSSAVGRIRDWDIHVQQIDEHAFRYLTAQRDFPHLNHKSSKPEVLSSYFGEKQFEICEREFRRAA